MSTDATFTLNVSATPGDGSDPFDVSVTVTYPEGRGLTALASIISTLSDDDATSMIVKELALAGDQESIDAITKANELE